MSIMSSAKEILDLYSTGPSSSLPPQTIAVGIDLGTTFSCIGYWKDGKVHFVEDESGRFLMPSVVSFGGNAPVIGSAANLLQNRFPLSTIYGAKNVIGRQFEDTVIQELMTINAFPYEIVKTNVGNMAAFKIQSNGKTEIVTPHLIASLVLGRLKELAEKKLAMQVRDVVISVPAKFTPEQQFATSQAADLAGLNATFIKEPTAAALSYGFKDEMDGAPVVVYDLGGGTFDVTILKLMNKGMTHDIKKSAGSGTLGGDFFDLNFVTLLKMNIYTETGKNTFSKKEEAELLEKCRVAKIELSTNEESFVLFKNTEFRLTRAMFEVCNMERLDKTFAFVRDCVQKSGIDVQEITNILLVGGSSRLPYVFKNLQAMFPSAKVIRDGKFDLAVVEGATLHAARIMNYQGSGADIPEVQDIVTESLRTSVHVPGCAKNKLCTMILNGDKLPCERQQKFVTVFDNQESIMIDVFSGDEEDEPKRENEVMKQEIKIPVRPAGEVKIMMTLKVHSNGRLDVSAYQSGSPEKGFNVQVKDLVHTKSTAWITELRKEKKLYEEMAAKENGRLKALSSMIKVCNQVKQEMSSAAVADDSERDKFMNHIYAFLKATRNVEKKRFIDIEQMDVMMIRIKEFVKNNLTSLAAMVEEAEDSYIKSKPLQNDIPQPSLHAAVASGSATTFVTTPVVKKRVKRTMSGGVFRCPYPKPKVGGDKNEEEVRNSESESVEEIKHVGTDKEGDKPQKKQRRLK